MCVCAFAGIWIKPIRRSSRSQKGKKVDTTELPNYGLRDAGRVQLGDSALGYGETGWYMYSKGSVHRDVPHIMSYLFELTL